MKKRKPITITLADVPEPMQNILEERAAKEGKAVTGYLRDKLMEHLLETALEEYDTWRTSFRKLTAKEQDEFYKLYSFVMTAQRIKNMQALHKVFGKRHTRRKRNPTP